MRLAMIRMAYLPLLFALCLPCNVLGQDCRDLSEERIRVLKLHGEILELRIEMSKVDEEKSELKKKWHDELTNLGEIIANLKLTGAAIWEQITVTNGLIFDSQETRNKYENDLLEFTEYYKEVEDKIERVKEQTARCKAPGGCSWREGYLKGLEEEKKNLALEKALCLRKIHEHNVWEKDLDKQEKSLWERVKEIDRLIGEKMKLLATGPPGLVDLAAQKKKLEEIITDKEREENNAKDSVSELITKIQQKEKEIREAWKALRIKRTEKKNRLQELEGDTSDEAENERKQIQSDIENLDSQISEKEAEYWDYNCEGSGLK